MGPRQGLLKTSSGVLGAGLVQSPAPCCYSQLLQLVLAGNAVGDAGAEVVCRLVASGDSLLQLLDLSR